MQRSHSRRVTVKIPKVLIFDLKRSEFLPESETGLQPEELRTNRNHRAIEQVRNWPRQGRSMWIRWFRLRLGSWSSPGREVQCRTWTRSTPLSRFLRKKPRFFLLEGEIWSKPLLNRGRKFTDFGGIELKNP